MEDTVIDKDGFGGEAVPAGDSTGKKKCRLPRPGRGFFAGLVCGLLIMLAMVLIFIAASKEFRIRSLIHSKAIADVDDDSLDDGKYAGMLASLDDKYAAYYDAETTAGNKQQKSGTYSGIGIVITQDEEGAPVTILGVYPGSPAENAGLLAGDVIIRIGEDSAEGLTPSEVSALIGEMGDKVQLTLSRDGSLYEVELKPGEIEVPKVYYEMKEDGIGYVALTTFIKTTASQFNNAMDALEAEGLRGLIIDLRGNTGGYVDTAVDCLDRILPEGLAVYTLDKNGKRRDYNVKGETPLGVPLVLLVDGNTASASEIFAGACRDRLGAELIGTVTFGKGIVQTTYFLEDGSSVKFTTANYHTPAGTDLNGTGLTPDIEAEPDLPEGETTVEACSAEDTPYQKALAWLRDRS